MFLRCKVRRKDGKQHRYWSVVENTRVAGGRVVQRHVLYLGEINDTQEAAWRRSIAVIEDGAAQPRTLSLFPEDRCEGLLADASIVRVKLSELRLRRPRQWGACWLALVLVAGTAARSVLVEAAGGEPQGDALGSGPVRAGRLPPAGAGQRMAPAPRVVSAQRRGRSLGRGCRARRDPQAVSLSRPTARAQASGLRSPGGTVARSVQHQLRRAALRSDEHLFRGGSAVSGRRQAPLRVLARSPTGLRADRHCAGGDARGSAAGL